MNLWSCSSIPAVVAVQRLGQSHLLHYALLYLAYFLLFLSIVGAWRIGAQSKSRRQFRQSLLNSDSQLAQRLNPESSKTRDWAERLPIAVKSSLSTVARKVWRGPNIHGGNSRRGSVYVPVLFVTVCAALLAFAATGAHKTTKYGWHVDKIVSDDQMLITSAEHHGTRMDFCPDGHIKQYLPMAGYTFCRIVFIDRGCIDIDGPDLPFEWVVDKNEQTTTMTSQDTFRPWPDCHKNELVSLGGIHEEYQKP